MPDRKQKFTLLLFSCVVLSLVTLGNTAAASNKLIKVLPTWHGLDHIPVDRVQAIVEKEFDTANYQRITAQVIHDYKENPSHIVVHLFLKDAATYEIAMVEIDAEFNALEVKQDHVPTKMLFSNQTHHGKKPSCPDTTIEFLSISPMLANRGDAASWDRDDYTANRSLKYAKEVAAAAVKSGYKTKTLFEDEATTQNILNYMVCPALVGTYFSGHAGNHSILTHDHGHLSYLDVDTYLSGKLKKAVNIWVACRAFNEPMLGAMERTGAQVYAAGINDVTGNASDIAAACAMKEALKGKPMETAFYLCAEKGDCGRMKTAFENCADEANSPVNKWGWYSRNSGKDTIAP